MWFETCGEATVGRSGAKHRVKRVFLTPEIRAERERAGQRIARV